MSEEELYSAIDKLRDLNKNAQFNELKTFAHHLLDQLEIESNSEVMGIITNLLGVAYLSTADNSKATEYLTKSLHFFEKNGKKEAIAGNLNNLGNTYLNLSDYPKALEFYNKALIIFEQIELQEGIALIYSNIGIVFKDVSDYTKALSYLNKSMDIYEKIGNKAGISRNLNHIGLIHNNLLNYSEAIENLEYALSINIEIENNYSVAVVLSNLGLIYTNIDDQDKALEYHKKALMINESIGNPLSIANNLANIGNIYYLKSDFNKAFEYLKKSKFIFEEISNKSGISLISEKIGKTYKNLNNYDLALENLEFGLKLSNEIGAKIIKIGILKEISEIYESIGDINKAFTFYKQHISVKEEVQSEDAIQIAEQFNQRRKLEEDEKSRLLKLARFQEQERIFHNILPVTIANRLIDGEQTIAESYENVSIFFSDIVGFTTLSSSIPPSELVKGLNTIFTAFDRIGTKYGLEKIKTIGDAYMAVCGVQEKFEDHQYRTTQFALEAAEVLKTLELGDEFKNLQIRIGLHCGSVVAGIIGEKKFAYDVWGDAVNIASRMESNSEAGRIHISEAFAKSIEHYPEFSIIPRGSISIKGKGMMNTYWLEKSE